ncbi:hypothetical protein Malapachy_0586 [Malassezia pachydermatis]|uniref:Diphthamide biosynthesis protein 4 n=1 Tax=Malassezia pachydermatis TaxID=77020 RepID=A0A0M8MHZ1_9BASI|nr:hypothetical protein Malapachy_0586 [Malassezia pachydermatis]KOS12836.1 hypothetical protein Malapachy_0586 [Malassezia pachydermatis]
MDAYAILGVAPTASLVEIRAAYLQLARVHHPDKQSGRTTSAEDERIREINHAYETLRDEHTRAVYDQSRADLLRKHATRTLRISEEVDLDAFELVDTPSMHFRYPCRCGQAYLLTPAQLADGIRQVPCTGCSETILVTWTDDDE